MDHDVAILSRAAERYALGEMEAAEREEFEAHFFECAVCGEDIRAADVLRGNIREELRAQQRNPKPSAEKTDWFAWMRPLLPHPALSAVMLAALAYPWLLVIPGLKRSVEEATRPAGVEATVLRAESRGAPAQAAITPGEPLLLALDVAVGDGGTPAGAALRAVIRGEGGELEVEAKAPRPGEPLHLYLPAPKLAVGKYTLTLYSGAQEIARYPFTVAPTRATPEN